MLFYTLSRRTVLNQMESYFYFPAELGEYDPQEHTMGYISEFRFIPNQVTTHCN